MQTEQGNPVVAIGDLSVSRTQVVTPTGAYPIRGTVWTVTDMTQCQNYTDPVGIILCVLFIWFCFVGLAFLAMRRTTWSGFAQVTVQGNGFQHTALIPAGPTTMAFVIERVNYARALAAMPA